MKFFRLFVNNKVVVYILTALIVIAGISAYISLPREASPSIEIPYVFISTVYVGVSPEEIEKLVTMEIEKQVKAISDIKHITSVSRESFSSVTVEFNPDIKIDDALQKVRDKISVAKTNMPSDIEEPVITEINFSELPMLYINIAGNYGLAQLKVIGDNLSDKIEGIPGVLSAEVVGGLEREVKINVDANRLKYYSLGLNDVTNAITSENLNIPGGGVDIGDLNYLVRVPGEIEDPAVFGDLVVKSDLNGNPIYVRDVAQVIYGYKERTSYSRENTEDAVTIIIKKQSGQNIIRIADEVKKIIGDERKNFPQGVRISFTGDQSKFIKNTVHELENGVVTGMFLVVGVLFLFMGFRIASLTATSIPLSFLISFIILNAMGITLNMIVLFTLILVLGIIVDDAVVVMENIFRLQEKENFTPYDAALEGPREVAFPVSVATLTIISSFFPLLFFPGIVGEFMRYLPITLIVTLFSSLFVAMVISPVQAAVFINVKKQQEKDAKRKFRPVSRFIEHFDQKFFSTVLRWYEGTLRYALKHKFLTIGGTVSLLIISFFVYGMFNNGVEFFPNVEPRQAVINVQLPSGTNIEKTNGFTKRLETKMKPFDDIEFFVANIGTSNNPMDFGGSVSNKSTITINFYDKLDRKRSSFESIENIRNAVTGIAGGDINIEKQAMGPPTGPPVNIEISGDDFVTLGILSEQIKNTIKDIPGLTDLQSDFNESRPEIKITIYRDKAAIYKLSTASIASTIRTAINGTEASKFRVGEDEYDITVRLDKSQRDNISSIENLYIANKDGVNIPITSVAKIEFSGGLEKINRKDQKRVVTVSGNAEGRLGNDVLKDVMARLNGFKLPDGYIISYTGENEEQEKASSFLGQAFLFSLLLIFFFMVMEFNSLRTPLIIMFSVLLSFIGVFFGLLVTNTPFGIMMTGIGVISLGGIVVRNAIVMLDFQKVLYKQGMPRDESLIKAGVIRLRPVFLTAACTILGLVPLTTGVDFDWQTFSWVIGGENTAFWRPMGVAIIFGLSVSTFLTLVVIPVIFSWVDDVMLRLKGKKKTIVDAPAKA
jgi:CzcA family heavy metal efflux pump